MNTLRYLRRIGVDQLQPPTLAGLALLQEQHLLTVPFENLDIGRGVPIVLDQMALYDKIVGERRGGFCYELNGLFGALLRELGYAVDMVSARVFNDEGVAGPEFDHMALIVTLQDYRYLVDVGFGDSARQPIILPHGEDEDVSGRYRVLPTDETAGAFALERKVEEGWRRLYLFRDEPHRLSDYVAMCQYHQSSPQSPFTGRNIITIATPTGRFTLTDAKVTETDSGLKMETPVGSPDEFASILAERFGIRW